MKNSLENSRKLVTGKWLIFAFAVPLVLSGCARRQQSSAEKYEAAKVLFESTGKQLHIPSAEAKGTDKLHLQQQALAGYRQILKQYPDQGHWAAQALRNIGNIYASQTNLTAAVQQFAEVERRYPNERWEVLMSWKSAADLLWDANQRDQAEQFYAKIVERFDTPDAAQVIKMAVRGCKLRMNGAS